MKQNHTQTCRPATAKARLTFVLALTLWLGCLPGLLAQAVPDRLNYQGILLKGDGTPVPAVPTDVEFRIWDLPENGTLLWGRTHRLTPDTNGAFNVVLMEGGSAITVGNPTYTSLAPVFTGTGSDSRYLELTVAGSTAIRPRQRFVASPYAFLAQNVVEPRPNFSVSGVLTVSGAANVGSLTASGAANVGSLTASGAANVGSLTATGAVMAASFVGSGAGLTNINTNSLVQQVVEALCPPGTIVAFGGTTVPSGWLLCDGASVSRATHARLFSAISTNWGTANATVFNLPDLRGMFLRGVSGTRTDAFADPDRNSRAVAATGGMVGNGVGSVQSDQLESHSHQYRTYGIWGRSFQGEDGSPRTAFEQNGPTDLTGGQETRPNNAYVNYIIKY